MQLKMDINGFLIKPNNPLELEKAIINLINDKKLYNLIYQRIQLITLKNNFDINLVGKNLNH